MSFNESSENMRAGAQSRKGTGDGWNQLAQKIPLIACDSIFAVEPVGGKGLRYCSW
jgi:hypothetical protein